MTADAPAVPQETEDPWTGVLLHVDAIEVSPFSSAEKGTPVVLQVRYSCEGVVTERMTIPLPAIFADRFEAGKAYRLKEEPPQG